ncbi:MAG: flavodoxin family protein [Hyphomicrobiales bacterium]
MDRTTPRKGMPDVQLTRSEFERRLRERFFDPAFEGVAAAIASVIETAWDGYNQYRKNPKTVRAGEGFAKPDFELPVEWLETRQRIMAAEKKQKDPKSRNRILLINGSMRSDQSCPGEISKTWRLLTLAKDTIDAAGDFDVDFLDLSLLTSQYGRQILPCKACVSTAQPLCHWPCSCYPNFAMGQVNDWMSEIYPMWVGAHGIMIVTPVNWYQAPSGLKSMIDRLVCADGGNPDLTSTGKNPQIAKEIELKGWDYPLHLAGRTFSVIVHGDAAGPENLRRILVDWLSDLGMIPAGRHGQIDAFIGYLESYAESHFFLDKDVGLQEDTRSAATALIHAVRQLRSGNLVQPDDGLRESRPK